MAAKLMIMSLGGSVEPLKKSIVEHRPERIIFFASHDSILKEGEVLAQADVKPRVETEITEDPNSLSECYRAARSCVDRAEKSGVPEGEVIVDYTGGTKVMTAALILATVGSAFRFNYVGGDLRTKGGLGVVENGHEKMYADMNPWSAFAEEERRQVMLLFNRRRYTAVDEIIRIACMRDLPRDVDNFFGFVRPLAAGLLCWEQFNHEKALGSIDKAIGNLREYIKHHGDLKWETLEGQVQSCRDDLGGIIRETERLKKLHPVLIKDLLSNARRRMLDGRYDDAAARIYRALELYGQIEFLQEVGCSNSQVPIKAIPDNLRDEYAQRYRDPASGALKLPLHATFRYLKEKDRESGHRYFRNIDKIKDIQSNRNRSILAHGTNPVSERACLSIFETVASFVGVNDFYDFPQLP